MTIHNRISFLTPQEQEKILSDSNLSTQILQEQRDDQEIQDYLNFYDGNEETIQDRQQIKIINSDFKQALHNTKLYKQKQKVTIRLNSYDLKQIKEYAFKKNIPYQTLIGATLHSFACDLNKK